MTQPRPISTTVASVLFALLMGACGSEDPAGNDGVAGGPGGQAEGGADSATDAATDADSIPDSGSHAETGSGDSGVDAGGEAGPDVVVPGDTGTDAAVDREGCKRGVAYGHHSTGDMTALDPGVSWWYNWHYAPDDGVVGTWEALGVEYVPMIWGANTNLSGAASEIPVDARYLLGFNEPNFFSQSDLSASEAASLWPGVESLADSKDLLLVSPAVNFCGGGCHDTDPVSWLNDFFGACSGCRADAIAMHIYVGCEADSPGLATNRAQWLINHVETYKTAFDGPLWLTEFACSGSPSVDEQKAFMQDAVAYLENEPRIARYAWFSGRADNMTNVDLLGADGELTELGQTYVSLPHNPACEM